MNRYSGRHGRSWRWVLIAMVGFVGLVTSSGALPVLAASTALRVTLPAQGFLGRTLGVTIMGTPAAPVSISMLDDAGASLSAHASVGHDGTAQLHLWLPATGMVDGPATVSIRIGQGQGAHYWQGSIWLATPHVAITLPVSVRVPAGTIGAGTLLNVMGFSVPNAQVTARLLVTQVGQPVTPPAQNVRTDAAGHYVVTLRVPSDIVASAQAEVSVEARSGIDRGANTAQVAIGPLTIPSAILPANIPQDTPSTIDAATAHKLAGLPGKVILISLAEQTMRAYDHGVLEMSTYVTTGRPELPTVTGIFHIYLKQTPFEFHSPWPLGSPFYYPPTWISYWMPFYEGYGIHDSSWRYVYGPGTNFPQGSVTGSHGCVNTPLVSEAWLFHWAPVGTTVVVY